MNTFDDKYFSIINAHYLFPDGKLSSTRYEVDFVTHQLVSKKPVIDIPDVSFDFAASLDSATGLNLGVSADQGQGAVMIYEVASTLDLDFNKRKYKFNIPNMIRCQNCETNYPTKYQYQRHQCEFNAEKVVLKPDADFSDTDKGKRVKYDCGTCGKQFVSESNLERHQLSHVSSKDNTCEHCKKQFVSENRLRIHKENHCKKSGDISKFYRSDVTVWRCKKCHEVFSSCATASFHMEHCDQQLNPERFAILSTEDIKKEPGSQQQATPETNAEGIPAAGDSKVVDKISTEILLQCEFCNRTYADKQVLLGHQKTHKTDKNYECVVCRESFDSYITASQHWLKKCSEKSNLFYLPKLTYCEFCDRTFKSHEILYTHKIKKRHYTPKFHTDVAEVVVEKLNNHDKDIKNEEVIDKLVEDVLIALEIPLKKRTVNKKSAPSAALTDEDVVNSSGSSKENVDPSEITVKTEPSHSNEDDFQENDTFEKRKRGRKRKLPKQALKIKKPLALEDGYKFQCERCVQVWETISALEEHRKTEHAASLMCDECGQVLHSARALLIHSRAHKSLKPYVCETCGRSYSQTSHLWQHMRFHQGIKPFACPHEGCEARYTIRPDLKDHIRKVHTRERPFKCNVCGKCFLTGSVYYQHRLIHTEDRRYGCDMCEKRFFRADALNNHKRIHTNERPYPCFVCGRLFRQKGDRNKHFRTQHPDAIDT